MMAEDTSTQAADRLKIEMTDQPISQRLKYGTRLHSWVLARLVEMIDDGRDFVRQRESDWDLVDQGMRMYVDLDRPARNIDRSEDYDTAQMPFKRTIVIPIQYAAIMTRMVELYSIMTARDPLVHLEGRDARDHLTARVHEGIIKWDNMLSRAQLVLWQLLFDQERYGICCLYDTWEEDWGWLYDEIYDMEEPDRRWDLRREWVNWAAINPRRLILDPNFSSWDVQRADFVGHEETYSWLHLKENEKTDTQQGLYFNVKAARMRGGSDDEVDDATFGVTTGEKMHTEYDIPVGTVSFVWAKIIPREWSLSEETRPEKWRFAVWEKKVVIAAHRGVHQHGQFPYSIGSMDLDMHAAFTPSIGEQLQGLQDGANWMAGSHQINTMKAINNEGFFAPSLIDPRSLLQPQPGKWSALTPRGERMLTNKMMSIDQMYSQKKIVDITQNHMQLVQQYLTFSQRVAGTPDPVAAMPLPTKRTLGEFEGVMSQGTKKIGITAQLFDLLVMEPTSRRHISMRQQFTSMPQIIRLEGKLKKELNADSFRVTPEHLVGEYDYIIHTPTMAPDPARSAAVWGQLMQIISAAPQLLAPDPKTGKRLNPHAILNEFFTAQGVRYLDQFYEEVGNAQMAGPGQIQQGVQAGNLVPMGGMGG